MATVILPSKMSLLFVVFMGIFLCISQGHTFNVGGHGGWTVHPLEDYNHWAERHRFQINDVLVFKYKKNHDSILVVSKDDYTKCNKDNPIKTLKDGHSKFKFSKSGPIFFISGHNQNCEMGQKMIVAVVSPDHHHNTTHSSRQLQPSSSSPASPSALPLPPVKQPSHSPTPFSGAKTPADTVEPPFKSPSPSPAVETLAHAPTNIEAPTQAQEVEAATDHSPSPSPTISHRDHSPSRDIPQAESPSTTNADASQPEMQHHRHAPAPAPAPSAAPNFGGSFVLLAGLISLVVVMISAGNV